MNFLFKVHTYLFYTIVACMFTSVFEMIYINDVRPALARAAFTLLQGTWFYQVCNHPWPLRVFGFRLISAYDSYIIWGHSITTWIWRGGRWSKKSRFLSTLNVSYKLWKKYVNLKLFSKCFVEIFSSHWGERKFEVEFWDFDPGNF